MNLIQQRKDHHHRDGEHDEKICCSSDLVKFCLKSNTYEEFSVIYSGQRE